MKQPPTFSTGDPSYFVVASTSGSVSPTALTVSKGSAGVCFGCRFIGAQYPPSRDAIQANRGIQCRCDPNGWFVIGSIGIEGLASQASSFSTTSITPYMRTKRFLTAGGPVLQKLVEGWAVNGIASFQTGDPLNIQVATSQLNTGTGNFANVTCSEVGTPEQVTQWFDTGCFAGPPLYEFGNYVIGDVRGPRFVNIDFSFFKRTTLGAARLLEFRVEIFNLFNKAHFSNPNTQFGNAQFGRISSTRFPSREIQLGARFLF